MKCQTQTTGLKFFPQSNGGTAEKWCSKYLLSTDLIDQF